MKAQPVTGVTENAENTVIQDTLQEQGYTMECEPEEWEALQLERYINQERNPELREALEDLDEFLFE